ncbi:sugar ABC transporter substrate-binding protein [Rathayibacter sp. VKM Ac-2754]|uniref:sugar ABC transporter substrate-binding protein n=1 Tax=Rathayibacter sp. VKM Ac-2754 TaxID=2609251 RepID=UPI0013578403|nr:sugar ABC transporter substrate-binding protein [Rathayibacter sp. VKM Ac-2754]MWV59339.1 substrate-binding domain-containing protein [Rathayibacter sp. VKM Ac-2754]
MSPAPHCRAGWIAVAITGTLLLAGCSNGAVASSDSADAGEGVAHATAQIEAASVDPEFTFEAEPFAMSGIAGKTIFNIPNSSAVPYITAVDEEGAAVAESYGATWVEYTNQGTPNEHTAGIDQAISQGADLILLSQGVNGELIIPALERAQAAGIPVVISHTYQNGDELPEDLQPLIAAQITAPFNESGALNADWAIKETQGEGDMLIITSAEVPPSDGIVAAMQAEFDEYCPGCSVKVVNVPVADWATKIATTVQSELQVNPNLDYVLPVYDSMTLYVESGVTAAGKVGSVFTSSFNGTPDVMKIMQEGDVLTMDIGENVQWLAWATLDQVGRVLTGAPIVEDGNQETPLKVFTKDNVDEAGTPPVAGQGYGDAYVAGYQALWGLPE